MKHAKNEAYSQGGEFLPSPAAPFEAGSFGKNEGTFSVSCCLLLIAQTMEQISGCLGGRKAARTWHGRPARDAPWARCPCHLSHAVALSAQASIKWLKEQEEYGGVCRSHRFFNSVGDGCGRCGSIIAAWLIAPLQGLDDWIRLAPRALPWVTIRRPFRA